MDLQEREIDITEGGVASDVMAVIDLLPRMLHGRSLDDGVKSIVVTVGGEKLQAKCTVNIYADSGAARDKLKSAVKKTAPGWTCTNTSDTSATCTHP